MGRSSGSSGGGNNNNKGYQGPKGPVAPPSIQTKKVNKLRHDRIVENTVQAITKKQTSDPTRMQGSADRKAVEKAVGMRPGNYVVDSKGMPLRTKSGNLVLTSKGQKEVKANMRRIPLSKAQFESQKKISNVLTIPLMLIPGGGLIRAGIKNKQQNNVFEGGKIVSTYGGENLLSDAERDAVASAQAGKPVTLRSRKKKTLLSTVFDSTAGKLGVGGNL
tara:strand:- start:159 stop:815 length:657 start_codon:yes stop_codon:yes gene_type:complete